MARNARLRPSRRHARLDFPAIEIVGALLTPDMVVRIAAFDASGQTESSYGIKPGLKLRDEIARYYRIGEALFARFQAVRVRQPLAAEGFMLELLRECFGFDSLKPVPFLRLGEREFPVKHAALGGRVPMVIAPARQDKEHRPGIDESLPQFGDGNRRRTATLLLQEYLNAVPIALWGIATDGLTLRLMRDNASMTRPAWIEADLAEIFGGGLFADFSVLWLLLHQSRFGAPGAAVSDCVLEQWRERGRSEGVTAREKLRDGFEAALRELGQGFIEHRDNDALRAKLAEDTLKSQAYFEELLRLVYRLIFLFAAEDRGLLHPPDAAENAKRIYGEGYAIGRLRERAMRRTAWDRHGDAWEGLKASFKGLARGEPRLGLPALGGLFSPDTLPNLESAKIENRRLLAAIFRLAWFHPAGQPLTKVNWRDMETEELGSVYESLLELTPRAEAATRRFHFAEGDETKGNARKTSGSYYTPDALVKLLLDSTLDPVLDAAELRNPQDPAAEILKLTILDPACGSGHFLLGAARRAAARIAKHRSPEGGAIARTAFQHALREVVAHCIYGVDRNPMAVELCKVALWIEALEPGKPLTFLESHIRCGDSLIGVFDINVLRTGIPEEAFKQLPGDNGETASHYRAKNKRELKEREKIESGLDLPAGQIELSKAFAGLHEQPEDSLDDIEAKRRLFETLTARGGAAWKLSLACELWTSSWFTMKSELPSRGRELVPTSGQVWEYLRGVTLYGPLIAEADRCSQEHRFFHWPVEFPSIVAEGGFDVVIGNPPWETVKLEEEQFFAARSSEIAHAKNAAARKKLISSLPETDPRLASEWNAAVRSAACESAFLRNSGRYPLGGVGDINTYAVFADFFRQAINDKGRTGLILPTGLVSGFTYRDFLAQLTKTKTLVSFYGFENEELIFPHITNKMKFGVLTLTGSQLPIEQPWFTANIRRAEQAADPERRYALSVGDIEAINPNTLNIPAFRWARDAEVTAAIHRAAPVLIRKQPDGTEENPWQVRLRTQFHMAGASGDFLDHRDIAPLIIERRGALAVLRDGRRVYPLYEGKMFWHFDHRYGTYEGQTEKQANKGVLPQVSDAKHGDPEYRIEPRYWVDEGLTTGALDDKGAYKWFFAWRDVGIAERTFIGTIIPRTAAGDTSPVMLSPLGAVSLAGLVGCLSSLVVDYSARQRAMRMKFFVIEQLPVPLPHTLSKHIAWLGSSAEHWLADRVLELCYTSLELTALAADLGREHPPFLWNPERRVLLQAEIDAAVLHLYGLNRNQAEWLIDSFTVLRKYEEKEHDEFRTKRVVLEIFDSMEAAKRAALVFESRLSPVAAAPSLCLERHAETHAGPPPLKIRPVARRQVETGAWARPGAGQPGDVGAALAAILKTIDGPRSTRDIRLAAVLVLEPRLLPLLIGHSQAAEWRRGVGAEANPLNSNLVRLIPQLNAAWGAAVRHLRANGQLIEDLDDDTWAPGKNLDTIETSGWPDGRAQFVVSVLDNLNFDSVQASIPQSEYGWVMRGSAI